MAQSLRGGGWAGGLGSPPQSGAEMFKGALVEGCHAGPSLRNADGSSGYPPTVLALWAPKLPGNVPEHHGSRGGRGVGQGLLRWGTFRGGWISPTLGNPQAPTPALRCRHPWISPGDNFATFLKSANFPRSYPPSPPEMGEMEDPLQLPQQSGRQQFAPSPSVHHRKKWMAHTALPTSVNSGRGNCCHLPEARRCPTKSSPPKTFPLLSKAAFKSGCRSRSRRLGQRSLNWLGVEGGQKGLWRNEASPQIGG